jgi:hypothetical protein
MSKCAVVQQSDNVCVNLIIAEASDPAPDGCFLVDIDNMACDIGWIYDPIMNDFINPAPPPPPEEPVPTSGG